LLAKNEFNSIKPNKQAVLFNSFEFLLFLPIVFILYWFVFNKKLSWQNGLVLVASYFFYGWWSWKFMGLLMLSTALDYAYGFWVASPNRKKAKLFLWLSIINNLGILGVFKYYNFFAVQFQKGFELLGLHTNPVLLQVALPIGISFYTFHGMSYVFDIYRGNQKPVRNFVDYAVFVSFFPLLVAGPIERASHLLPQVQKPRSFNYSQAVEGCRLILWGTAKLFGFELLSNFKFPYFSRDVAEFWRRWHISLSSWFRDYLYIPLGGSKNGKYKAIRNTFIIFLVSGFWHGASWNFIAWGFIHACGFLPLLLRNRNRKHVTDVVAQDRKLPNFKELWQMSTTFAFVTFAWIFFRAHGIQMALAYIKKISASIIGDPGQLLHLPGGKMALIYIVPLIVGDWYLRRDERSLKMPNIYWESILTALIIFLLVFNFSSDSSFIYFQF